MKKRALCVGINAYQVKPLNGCVNDANDWAELLVSHFDFVRDDVKRLLDRQATKGAIVAGLQDLLAGARKDDVLVFVNSSHGAEVRDTGNGDESVDEAICPVNYADGVVVDDELRDLFRSLPAGVSLTVISDSCHSGTVTRDPSDPAYPVDYAERPRFLDWDFLPEPIQLTVRALLGRTPETRTYTEEGMREILLAGSRDNESSYDARFAGRFQGVMTHYALQAIRESAYRLTYDDLGARTAALVAETHFSSRQHPQLEGRPESRSRQIFT